MPPVNDNFVDAISLSGASGSVSGDLTGGTVETSEPYSWAISSVWYEYTPSSSGWVSFTGTLGTASWAYVSFYTGSTISGLTSHGTFFIDGSTTAFKLVSGTSYKIYIVTYSSSLEGTFTIDWSPYVTPSSGVPYDNIQDALELINDGAYHTISIDNTGATVETNELSWVGPPRTIWFKFDLTSFDGYVPVHIAMNVTAGTIIPALQFVTVDPSFDPTDPDFSLITNYDSFFGNGTQTLPDTEQISYTPSDNDEFFYAYFYDYSYSLSGEGTTDITYLIPAPGTLFPDSVYSFTTIDATLVLRYLRGSAVGTTTIGASVVKEGGSGESSSIINYFRDGAWHQANAENTRDLHYFRNGAWRRYNAELDRTMKVYYSGSWQG